MLFTEHLLCADWMQEEGHREWVLWTFTPSREVGIRHLSQDPPSRRPSMLLPHTAAQWSRVRQGWPQMRPSGTKPAAAFSRRREARSSWAGGPDKAACLRVSRTPERWLGHDPTQHPPWSPSLYPGRKQGHSWAPRFLEPMNPPLPKASVKLFSGSGAQRLGARTRSWGLRLGRPGALSLWQSRILSRR